MVYVASYCRVSTDREDQANSFESQKRYFRDYILRHPDWELYEVYADEGLSGTSTKKRTQFNRMINDAYSGKFKWILTKEVSRFSRNLLDTIAYTRDLKALGIGVIFMNDGFTSLDPDSELRLSIMGSIAQEESRKTSCRVKWGQLRQMERGVVFGTSLLGYDVCDGKLMVNKDGAETVRLIFHKYAVENKGTSVIARELQEAGIKTYSGGSFWNSSQIVKILRNEKYVGDLVQKKTITPDYLTHKKKINHGEEEKIIIENHHEPIVEREVWNTAQKELGKRNRNNRELTGHSNQSIFSGKMICGECGASFISRNKTRKNGTSYKRWLCYTATIRGMKRIDPEGKPIGCDIGKTIRNDLAMEALTKVIQRIPVDFAWIVDNLTKILNAVIDHSEDSEANYQKIKHLINNIEKKKDAAIDAFLSGAITLDEKQRTIKRYNEKISTLQKNLKACHIKPHPQQPLLLNDLQIKMKAIVSCEVVAEPYYKMLLEKMVIKKDSTLQIKLNHLPQMWSFEILYHTKNL